MRWNSLIKKPLFALVVVPTILSGVYFSFVASDIFVSESHFVIRSQEKSSQSGLGALLQGAGFARTEDGVYAVRDFIESRDALALLETQDKVSQMFGGKNVDMISRFDPFGVDKSFEGLYKYYSRRVDVDVDSTSGITTLTVNAFSAHDAYKINDELLRMAERLVNKMNARMQLDLVESAQREVDTAKSAASTAEANLAAYRTSQHIYDPERQSSLQLQQVAKLQGDIVETKAQIAQLRLLSPGNPQLQALQTRLMSLQQQVEGQLASVAGGESSLTEKAGRYSRLQLEQVFAEKQLASAMATLEAARNEAMRKQMYVEVVASPNEPDVAIRPHRLKDVLVTFVGCLIIWGIVSLLLAGVREHHD